MLCGLSLNQFVEQYPDCVGFVLPNGKKISSEDPNNKMLTLCFTCISQYTDFQEESLGSKEEEFADEDLKGNVASFSCCGDEDMTAASFIAPNYFPSLVAPGKS